MPELPDLEVFKTNIFNRLSSKRLIETEVFNTMKVTTHKGAQLGELNGLELLSVGRFGKELIFDFGERRIIAVHLMLSGKPSIVAREEAGAVKYKIFAMHFQRETLVFSDNIRQCTVKYKPASSRTPDAFGASFTPEYFIKAAGKRPIVKAKAFLTDQSVVKGIGNAYADEILWAARVSPHSFMCKIPQDALLTLYNAIGTVLRDAIESIKRIDPGIISGEVRDFLKVHNAALKATETGFPVIVEYIASKKTYYTEEQTLYK